jgi:cytochrome P450
MSIQLYLALIGVFAGFTYLIHSLLSQKRRKLPPGPSPLPIIGNLHQAPQEYPWRVYQEWTKKYGPIFSLQYGINTVIMLGTYDAAHDLLDKRSNIYSSRPRVVMGNECVSKGNRNVLMPYGQQWRNHHRLQANFLNIRVSQTYRELQDLESKQVMFELLDPKTEFGNAYHRYASSLIFALAYGRRLTKYDDPEALAIDKVMENFVYASRIGTWLVDAIPLLNYLPNFLAPWKRFADRLHDFESDLFKTNLWKGCQKASWNFAKHARGLKEAQEMSEKELSYGVGVLYEAGSDTTTVALVIFTLAMIHYSDAMKKAQAELDAVVGDSFPTFDDRDRLPYIDAVIKETLRWRPIAAGGMPHAVTEDDEYMGYHIPKGSIVVGNHWSISLDEDVYEDPYRFNPDRWIAHPDLPLAAFGFGRRLCPGQHIAKNSLYINIARILWAFNIGYKYNIIDGKKVRCDVDAFATSQGFIARPDKFDAVFEPRLGRDKVVADMWNEAEKDIDVILGKIQPPDVKAE